MLAVILPATSSGCNSVGSGPNAVYVFVCTACVRVGVRGSNFEEIGSKGDL